MTVITFIVGFVIGAIGALIGAAAYAMKVANMSPDELEQVTNLIIEAGNNRESMLELTYDDNFYYGYNSITFEAR